MLCGDVRWWFWSGIIRLEGSFAYCSLRVEQDSYHNALSWTHEWVYEQQLQNNLINVHKKIREDSDLLFYYQSISVLPMERRYSFALLKCLQPKNPRYADNGDGCTDVNMQLRLGSTTEHFR